jgi:2-polyprenyl-3-methyl-5-hydroxy-6-metoxy-1,4-benzoquinol methylase
MPILRDPHNEEAAILLTLADFRGKRVLEVGCGDGRLTWAYAALAADVVGIDPEAERIAAADVAAPPELRDRLRFLASGIEAFAGSSADSQFDIIVFSWSLC